MADPFAAYCHCDLCMRRLEYDRTPIHLKRYDDTASARLAPQAAPQAAPAAQTQAPSEILDTVPLPRCECSRCTTSRASGKIPFHLKAVDDTPPSAPGCVCTEHCALNSCVDECRCHKCITMHSLRVFVDFESAYLSYWGPSVLKSGLDYDECSSKELKCFIEQRGLQDPFPPGLTLKTYYLPVLNAADRVCSFPFLDPNFPAEMRLMVYGHLFAPRKLKNYRDICFPQILSTCKQINQEAQPEIFKHMPVTYSFHTDVPRAGKRHYDFLLHDEEVSSRTPGRTRHQMQMLEACELPLHGVIKKFTTAKVLIVLESFSARPIDGLLQNCLLLLASSLMQKPDLKKLTIEFGLYEWGGVDRFKWLAEPILAPLRRLRNIAQVEVIGCVTDKLAKSIQTDMQGNSPTSNTWKLMRRTFARNLNCTDFIRLHKLEEVYGKMWLLERMYRRLCEYERFNMDLQEYLFEELEEEDSEAAMREDLDEMLEEMPSMAHLEELRVAREAKSGIKS